MHQRECCPSCLGDMALRLLRMLPASEAVALEGKRGGGAKSSAVKVPDFLSRWLRRYVSWWRKSKDRGDSLTG